MNCKVRYVIKTDQVVYKLYIANEIDGFIDVSSLCFVAKFDTLDEASEYVNKDLLDILD